MQVGTPGVAGHAANGVFRHTRCRKYLRDTVFGGTGIFARFRVGLRVGLANETIGDFVRRPRRGLNAPADCDCLAAARNGDFAFLVQRNGKSAYRFRRHFHHGNGTFGKGR